jgi:hypothetical protein
MRRFDSDPRLHTSTPHQRCQVCLNSEPLLESASWLDALSGLHLASRFFSADRFHFSAAFFF